MDNNYLVYGALFIFWLILCHIYVIPELGLSEPDDLPGRNLVGQTMGLYIRY